MGKRRKETPEFVPLTEMLAKYGFVNQSVRRNNFLAHLYQKGDLYIEVHVSLHPHDYPFFCSVSLGEGSTSWPEADWNSAALFLFVEAKVANSRVPDLEPYGVKSIEEVGGVILKVRDDIEQFCQDYLSGDLSMFRRVRAAQNQGRSPYLIHKPGPDGKYETEAEPVSQMLKDRYSEPG